MIIWKRKHSVTPIDEKVQRTYYRTNILFWEESVKEHFPAIKRLHH